MTTTFTPSFRTSSLQSPCLAMLWGFPSASFAPHQPPLLLFSLALWKFIFLALFSKESHLASRPQLQHTDLPNQTHQSPTSPTWFIWCVKRMLSWRASKSFAVAHSSTEHLLICCLLTLWQWVNYSTSLSPGLLIWKVKIMVGLLGCCVYKMRYAWKTQNSAWCLIRMPSKLFE